MSTETRTPLSPRLCGNLSLKMLDNIAMGNHLVRFDEVGQDPSPKIVRVFDLIDDLIGTNVTNTRGIGIVVESVINGQKGWTSIVQSTCGCVGVSTRIGDEIKAADGGSAEGFMSDMMRRILGLATAPEPTHPMVAITDCWIAELVGVSAKINPIENIYGYHPFLRNLPPELPEESSVERLLGGLQQFYSWMTWEELRGAAIDGEFADCSGLTPEEVAWMDAGTFARWTLGSHHSADPTPLFDLLTEDEWNKVTAIVECEW